MNQIFEDLNQNFGMIWRTFPWSRKCLSVFFLKKLTLVLIVTESFKTQKSCISWRMFKMEFKFSGFLAIRSKALCLGLSEPAGRLVAQSTACALFSHSCLLLGPGGPGPAQVGSTNLSRLLFLQFFVVP